MNIPSHLICLWVIIYQNTKNSQFVCIIFYCKFHAFVNIAHYNVSIIKKPTLPFDILLRVSVKFVCIFRKIEVYYILLQV